MTRQIAGLRGLNCMNTANRRRILNRSTHTSALVLIILAIILLLACGGGSHTTAPTIAITTTSGSGQSAVINAAFAAPLVATVTSNGAPSSGVLVTFAAPSSGASGTFAGGANTATTNASGVATSAVFTANATAGAYTVTASTSGAASSASFSLTNTTAPTIVITTTSGSPQSAVINAAFAAPLVATVTSNGAPSSGVLVTFTAPSSGASGTFAGAANTATTNSSGVATSAVFTANATAGAYTVTASTSGAASSASFSLTNTAGPAATITATSGSGQSASADTAFAAPLVATVLDNGSNPVSGVTVTFTAPSSGASGTFAGGVRTATTNASGVATSGVFTANETAGGPYTVTATVGGVSTPADFSLTNTAALITVTATSGSGQSAAINSAFSAPLVATVKTGGIATSGVVVTFTAPSTGASGSFAGGVNTATTNGSGVATSAVFTANGTLGTYTVTASAPSASNSAGFSLTNTAGPAAAITATSGTPQSATFGAAFAAPLVVTVVDAGSNPVSGATVTFTAPSTGASGTFAGGVNTATTNAEGVATSAVFTANSTVGGPYTVSAAVTGVVATASFSLTNTGIPFSFYMSGAENNNPQNFYSLAGAITVDGSGNVIAGEQDYNDAATNISPQPSGDSITGGTLTVDPTTGLGTLTLITNNTLLGQSGTETLGVQFVNSKHALIVEFDGAATSSGSMDQQTIDGTPSGYYAFTFSGVDSSELSLVVGGVFQVSGTSVENGLSDVDDFGAGTVTEGNAFSGTIAAPDAYGRGSITGTDLGTGQTLTLNYYVVGPEALRFIDMDNFDSGIGLAFGQGANPSFTKASVGSSVFGVEGNFAAPTYAAAGMFTTVSSAGTFSGVAEDDEQGAILSDTAISGTYTVASSGYGHLNIANSVLGSVSFLGIYLADPNLNLLDPNNTTSGLGGAVVADLDINVSGTGLLIPQTSVATANFAGKYAFGAQSYNAVNGEEFDFVGQGTVTSLALTGTGLVSDPFDFFDTPVSGTDSGATFSGTAVADSLHPGRYAIPLQVSAGICTSPTFQVVIYQANGGQLLWLDEDSGSLFLGTVEKQGTLTGLPALRRPATRKKPLKVRPQC